jgi:quercetin dioxygenase-like cupin family protein
MKRKLSGLLTASVLALTSSALPQASNPLKRTPIATVDISPNKTVSHVQVTRLDFQPGQMTGRHLHPVPVAGYVESGAFIVQLLENQSATMPRGK